MAVGVVVGAWVNVGAELGEGVKVAFSGGVRAPQAESNQLRHKMARVM